MTETILGDAPEAPNPDATLVTELVDVPKEDVDAKPAEGDNASEQEGDAKKGEDNLVDKPEGAPETYADFTLPEGMESDAELMAKASTTFKELNLSQEQAQQLVDLQASMKQEELTATMKAWEDTTTQWRETAANDKEYGGAEFKANMEVAKAGRDAFGNDAFTEMLEVTGTGNHPEMVRFLFNLGKAVKDDNILQGSKSGAAVKDHAAIMFPNMN